MKSDDKIIKLHKSIRLVEDLDQFHELSTIKKVVRISTLLQQVYCHIQEKQNSEISRSFKLKEYAEFFLTRYTSEQTLNTIYLNFVSQGMSLEKCVEPSDWPTICRQDSIEQVFLMFLFLIVQNEYIEEIKS